MKTLVAIKSCQKHIGYHERIRRTWAKHLPANAELKFFVGGDKPEHLLPDEVWFDTPDGYEQLSLKVRSIVRHALVEDYDFVLLADTDTFILPSVFSVGFEEHDYVGQLWHGLFCLGGLGYFLSRRACHVLSTETIDCPEEDIWVANHLKGYIARGELTRLAVTLLEVYTWHQGFITMNTGRVRQFELEPWFDYLYQTKILNQDAPPPALSQDSLPRLPFNPTVGEVRAFVASGMKVA